MATLRRDPLATRPLTNQISSSLSPVQSMLRKLSSSKRAHSPEPSDSQSAKRSRAFSDTRSSLASREDVRKYSREPKLQREERERRRTEREEEFKIKYSRAFPTWVFYFDIDPLKPETAALRKDLERLVHHMNGRIDDFFSKDVTHLIVLEHDERPVNKENIKSRQSRGSLLSPIKLKGRSVNEHPVPASELVQKATEFDIKIWSAEKLRNVIDRCRNVEESTIGPSTTHNASHRSQSSAKERPLTRLLESERLHGTTERDPTQKRHDYVYFSKNSYFVLVEDMRQELATIVALEYPISKSHDGKEKGSWPVLYCHHRARGPFMEYDEKEERRREKAEKADQEREKELERRKAKLRQERRKAQQEAQRKGDLRRTVSMNNMRRASLDNNERQVVELDTGFDNDLNSAAASGYLASGTYIAASGNSVGITSATGTTSTAGLPFRTLQLPSSLRGKLQQQVLTSRRVPNANGKENLMGPPTTIPEHPQRLLRKSRSTNTMRLPKREEGSKPGYCESCRVKFEDFKEHIHSRKHRKFADDDSNFANLDAVLSRVRRRTREETAAERAGWMSSPPPFAEDEDDAPEDADEDFLMTHVPGHAGDDIQWDDWVDTAEI